MKKGRQRARANRRTYAQTTRDKGGHPLVGSVDELNRGDGRPRIAGHVWRRLHDGTLIAEAATIPGMGSWRVCVYRVSQQSSEKIYVGRAFSLLTDAHKAADDLVQQEFAHECRTGVCGRWLRWRGEAAEES